MTSDFTLALPADGEKVSAKQPDKSGKSPARNPEKKRDENERLVAQNRKARHEYEVLDTVECGMVLKFETVKY